MLSRDALLADLSRALRAHRPDAADDLLREIEGAQQPQRRVARGRLLEELMPLVRAAFPSRAEELLVSLSQALWPAGVLGPIHAPALAPAPASIDLERDEWPSFVVVGPAGSPHLGLRLLLHLESMTLGARADVELPLSGAGLSPRHLLFTLDANGGVLVEDLSDGGSLAINGKPTSWAWMQAGDRVRCGALELRFVPPLSH